MQAAERRKQFVLAHRAVVVLGLRDTRAHGLGRLQPGRAGLCPEGVSAAHIGWFAAHEELGGLRGVGEAAILDGEEPGDDERIEEEAELARIHIERGGECVGAHRAIVQRSEEIELRPREHGEPLLARLLDLQDPQWLSWLDQSVILPPSDRSRPVGHPHAKWGGLETYSLLGSASVAVEDYTLFARVTIRWCLTSGNE